MVWNRWFLSNMDIFWYLQVYVKFLACNGWGFSFSSPHELCLHPDLSSFWKLGLPGSFVNTWFDNDIHLHLKEKCALFVFLYFFSAEKLEKTSTMFVFDHVFLQLIPSWWLNQPIWKNARQIGSSPQFSRWKLKMFELPPPIKGSVHGSIREYIEVVEIPRCSKCFKMSCFMSGTTVF